MPNSTITWPQRAEWWEIASGVALPETFEYFEEPPGSPATTLHVAIGEDGWVCERLELQARPDVAVNTSTMRRVHVTPMLSRALLAAARPITFDSHHPDAMPDAEIKVVRRADSNPPTLHGAPTDRYAPAWLLEVTAEERAAAVGGPRGRWQKMQVLSNEQSSAVRAAVTPPSRPRSIPIDDDDLRRIADTYREAVATRQPPTEAVRLAFHVSRSTASRWIRRARELGLLGAARPRVAGEFGKRDQ